MTPRIAVLPGDGVGPEVTRAAVAALRAAAAAFGHALELEEHLVGGAAIQAGKPALPPETLEACRGCQAVLLGAVGDPRFDALGRAERPEAALLALRKALGLYANLRPARLDPPLADASPLRPERAQAVDLLVVRELGGGLYFGEPRGEAPDGRSAVNTLPYSEAEVERIAEVAFAAAEARRRRVTSVDKANVLETSRLWRRVVGRVAERHPGIAVDHMYVDACAMSLVLEPGRFDVVLTENLFGDILSDEAGAIIGSLGLLPSASLGTGPGLFEPVHGSAPTLAGRDLANPLGAIGSAALLLRHALGWEDAARSVEEAVSEALRAGCRTADLLPEGAASLGCAAMTEAVVERIRATSRLPGSHPSAQMPASGSRRSPGTA